MEADSSDSLSLLDISEPSSRKCCNFCNKNIYFHQTILLCHTCREIFHGKCLNLSNDKVFLLQQIHWNCRSCSTDSNKIRCNTCLSGIDIYNDTFRECKKCSKIVHYLCITSRLCKPCLPIKFDDFGVPAICNDNNISHDNDYLTNQPYFTPFSYYEKEVVNFVDEINEMSDDIARCSNLLSSCSYHKVENLKSRDNEYAFINLNIDGFKKNFDNFKVFANEVNTFAHGFFINECNVTEVEAKPFYVNNYNKFVLNRLTKKDGKLKKKGSGLVTFLHQRFSDVTVHEDLCFCSSDFEYLTTCVVTKTDKLLLVNCYRSPSGSYDSFLDSFEDLLIKLHDSKFRLYKKLIFGDLNVNLYKPGTRKTRDYLTCILSNSFYPLISRATHFSGNPTCIDHILTDDVQRICESGIIDFNFGHHFPCYVRFSGHVDLDGQNLNSNKPRIKLNEFTVQQFISKLDPFISNFDFDVEADLCFSKFHEGFRDLYNDSFINNTNVESSYNKSLRSEWITLALANSCKKCRSLYIDWKKNSSKYRWNIYLDYKRKLDDLLKKTKFDYYDKKFKDSQGELKKTWQLVNGILGRKRSNKLLTFPEKDAAHNFNKYFTTVASDLIKRNYDSCSENDDFTKFMSNDHHTVLDNFTVDVDQVKLIISKLNNNKGTYFSTRILKIVSDMISPVLTILYNKCISSGTFPSCLKIAKIVPLFKNKGSAKSILNYRPISMLSTFSKIFEKLIQANLVDYIDTNNILNDCQYGFRKKHSTFHALSAAMENLYSSLDSKNFTLGIFIDFSRAFDTVSHSILIKKLALYGISGNVLKLLENYLTNRKQYVSYGGTDSELLDITCGVPQGSVLGPLLFILFINDIVNISPLANFVLFADDCNVFACHKNRSVLYDIGNDILDKIYEYCKANRLILNVEKCCFIDFSRNKKSDDEEYHMLFIGDKELKKTDSCKFLGVTITSDLNWDDQINHVCSKVSQACGSLYSLKSLVPFKILKSVYNALVQPYLMYCVPIWGSEHHRDSFNRIFKLQKKSIRIISCKTGKVGFCFQHTKPMFNKLKILTIHNIYNYITSVEALKILQLHSPANLISKYTVSGRSYRLIQPLFTLTCYKNKSFIFNSGKLLNYLLKNDISYSELSTNVFKARLKRHLLFQQSLSRVGDDSWLPCNFDLFSDISI